MAKSYIADLNEQEQNRIEVIIEQMKVAGGVTEEMNAAEQMTWVGTLNGILNRDEEIVLTDLIYI